MKITVYTITNCQFSKTEKEYLASHNLIYEEKNLETNREFLTEMLAVSNNFAGTPISKIEKDDGTIVVLKGFTKEEFDKVLGLEKPSSVPPTTPNPTDLTDSTTKPIVAPLPTSPPPITSVPPTPEPTSQPVPEPVQPAAPPIPSVPVTPDPLNAVLNNLQQKTDTPTT